MALNIDVAPGKGKLGVDEGEAFSPESISDLGSNFMVTLILRVGESVSLRTTLDSMCKGWRYRWWS